VKAMLAEMLSSEYLRELECGPVSVYKVLEVGSGRDVRLKC
jgi:hypothetical protein